MDSQQNLPTIASLAGSLLGHGGGSGSDGAAVLARAVHQLCSAKPSSRQIGISTIVGLFGEEYGLLMVTVVLLVAQLHSN